MRRARRELKKHGACSCAVCKELKSNLPGLQWHVDMINQLTRRLWLGDLG